MKPLVLAVTLWMSFSSIWNPPTYEHIDVFDEYIENDLTEEQQEIFTDEFIYTLISTCSENDVNPWYVLAIIENESSFNPKAVSSDERHLGLMQLSLTYHQKMMEDLGGEDLFDTIDNLTTGITYIGDLQKQVKNYKCIRNSEDENAEEYLVAMCYNDGIKYAVPNFKDGIISDYAKRVVNKCHKNENKYGEIDLNDILENYEEPVTPEDYITGKEK